MKTSAYHPFRSARAKAEYLALYDEAAKDWTETNTIFESTARALAVDEIIKMLEGHGCVIQADYGVRCMMDYWGDNERKTEPNTLAQLEELEIALSAEYPYKLLARFFQVIAQKT
ncbi:MAG: hypothetical protein SWK90_05750 [Chloroflexota bacterium]|nr:hypothetical protein [Chloroflexota bacterium]